MNPKILFIEWDSMGNLFIQKEMENAGLTVVKSKKIERTQDTRYSSELAEELIREIAKEPYLFVFSFDYFPVVAVACKACKVKYLSWIYDSPYIQLYSDTVRYETNYIFHFDQAEVIKFRNMGIEQIYYLPLSAPVETYDTFDPARLSAAERDKYTSDVSFVGSLYTEKKQYLYKGFDDLTDYSKGYIEGMIAAQRQVYGVNFLEDILIDKVKEDLLKACPIHKSQDGFETIEWVYADYFIARKLASLERRELLRVLSEAVPELLPRELADAYSMKLYTHDPTTDLPKVHNMGRVDYYNQAPYVFKLSKININSSLRSIRSGIPLRAMDIMGCGGFLMTNYQSDFLEHFVPDEDFVYFENMADLRDKVAYYLTHEDERIRIAQNGYQKMKRQHTFANGLADMISVAFE